MSWLLILRIDKVCADQPITAALRTRSFTKRILCMVLQIWRKNALVALETARSTANREIFPHPIPNRRLCLLSMYTRLVLAAVYKLALYPQYIVPLPLPKYPLSGANLTLSGVNLTPIYSVPSEPEPSSSSSTPTKLMSNFERRLICASFSGALRS